MNNPHTHWLVKLQAFWLLLALAAVIGFRASLLPWRPALLATAAAAGGLALTGFCSLALLFVLLRAGRRGGKQCLISVALSLPALIGVLLLGMQGAKAPPIHDISTDTVNPPAFSAAKALRKAGDNSLEYAGTTISERQRQAYPDIAPIETPMPPAEAFLACRAAATGLGWRVLAENRDQGVIEAVDRTLIFGFADDIVVRVTAVAGGSRIDLRSASRAGVSDLGVNAKRIRAFTRAFNHPTAQ